MCLNEKEHVQDAKAREAIVDKLRSQLKAGAKALVGNKGYRRFLRAQGKDAFSVDEESVQSDAIYDGIWVLRTNTELETEVVARAYKDLWMVEDLFRTTKTILETRPIYHRCDETIRGHVFCSFLALLLKTEMERKLRERNRSGTGKPQEVEAMFQGRRFVLRSQLVGHAHKAIRASGAAVPATIREE